MIIAHIETEYVNCDLCGSDDQRLLCSRVDPVTNLEFHLVECGCGMAFVNPMPKEDSIHKLYPSHYLDDKSANEDLYRKMIALLPERRGRLLDLGCGGGHFIRYASEHGWTVEGVDLISWNQEPGVPIHVGDFLEMDLPERSYDVITAWAMLEHVRRPSQFFSKVSRLLAENGQFIFTVPNFHAPGIRRSCTDDIPRHLWLFSPQAVTAYLDRFGMAPRSILHNTSIYTSYPFGIVRYAFLNMFGTETRSSRYENRAVALLRNRQIKGNMIAWLKEVFATLKPGDLVVDAVDGGIAITLANVSKLIGNYGVITVIAGPKQAK